MPKYENSVIYKIKHNEDYDDNDIYVGSTSNFKNRKNQHKTACNNEKNKDFNLPVYQYIRDNGNWNNFVMIPIEEYPCNSKNELEIKERYHIDLLRPSLNKNIPGRTYKEYYEANKEQILEMNKNYREDNKKQIAEKIKKRYEDNKQIKTEYNKKYREANKEILNQKNKEYNEANKEKNKTYQKKYRNDNKKKVICDHCGCEVRKQGLNAHEKTKKCINFVKTE